MKLFGNLASRIVGSLALLIVVPTIIFFIQGIAPTNVARGVLGLEATPEMIADFNHRLGLDQPLIVRYLNWLLRMATGDLGSSYTNGQSVQQILALRLSVSLSLIIGALMIAASAMLEVVGLTVTYSRGFGRPPLTAVSDMSFTVGRGETVSIVGESGSGKTTIGSAILGLQPVAKGAILLNGADIAFRETLQAVFQDPYSSLDPTKTIGDAVGEPLRVAEPKLTGETVRRRVAEALERVGLDPGLMRRFPAEFSGGQRQRIAIARALILKPEMVVCDEAVSALDVSVQAQVLNLLESLQRDDSVSYIFISHNMAAVRHISDRIVVLYRGRIMEEGFGEDVCDRPAHPCARSLLASVPVPDVRAQRERRRIRGLTVAASRVGAAPQSGCPFAPRCPFAADLCTSATPPLVEIGGGRRVACVRIKEIPEADEHASLAVAHAGEL